MDTGKRDFMKLSALAASGMAANWLLPRTVFSALPPALAASPAEGDGALSRSSRNAAFSVSGPISLEECQSLDYREMAARSSMVQSAWQYLQEETGKIATPALRELVSGIYADSTPLLAGIGAGGRQQAWEQLGKAGYTTQSLAGFLPPVPQNMNVAYPCISAPGSGYGSHHAYPGGLITHVAANVKITAAIVDAYERIYGYKVNRDIAMAAQLLHDLHKPYVFQWRADASSRTEQPLAGTGEHHVLSLAELLARKAPAELVVAQACAHTHPGNDADEAQVVGWLKAAAMIAGTDPVRYGLLGASGKTLPLPRRQEGFICHLGDHDFVLSVPAVQWTLPVLKRIAVEDYGISDADLAGKPFNSLRNMMYSQLSAMRLEQAFVEGEGQLRALLHSVVKPV
ncbi:MAG: HD domain-containing protein [Planctomycetota bacterium]|nr:HD domain-containing protein [Planctomycetota bacterium]